MPHYQAFKNVNDGSLVEFESAMKGKQILLDDISIDSGYILRAGTTAKIPAYYNHSGGTTYKCNILLQSQSDTLARDGPSVATAFAWKNEDAPPYDAYYLDDAEPISTLMGFLGPQDTDFRNKLFGLSVYAPPEINGQRTWASGIIIGTDDTITIKEASWETGEPWRTSENDVVNMVNLKTANIRSNPNLLSQIINNIQIQTHPYRYIDILFGERDHSRELTETKIYRVNYPTDGLNNRDRMHLPLPLSSPQTSSSLEVIVRNDLGERIKLLRDMHLGFLTS